VPNGFGHDRVRSVFVGIRYVLNDAKSYLEPLDVAPPSLGRTTSRFPPSSLRRPRVEAA
jgi:hypothetical protein